MTNKSKELDGLRVKLLGRTFDVAEMERRQETTSNVGHGGSYTISDVIVFSVDDTLPKHEMPDEVYDVTFIRGDSELEEIQGTLVVDHFADGTRFTLSTLPKPVLLPTVEQDTIGKTS